MVPKRRRSGANGTSVGQPTFRWPIMDDKTINLWKQIEGARRVGKRRARERATPGAPRLADPIRP